MAPWPKRAIWLTGLLVLAAGVVLLIRPSAIPVELATVVRGSLEVTIDEEGMTRVRDRYTVAAPFAGQLSRISLKEGDPVSRGQVVARLDPAPLDPRAREQAEARLRAAEDAQRVADAVLQQARDNYGQAVRDRERADSLAAQGLLSPQDRERAQLAQANRLREIEAANYRAQAAQHDVEQARAALIAVAAPGTRAGTAIDLRAPVTGRVLRVVEPDVRVVAAGAPVLELGDPRRLEVVADLLSVDAVKVAPGDTMRVEEWGGGKTLLARVRMVEPSGFTKVSALGVEEQRVNVIGDFIDSVVPLGDRYRVQVRVVVWQAPEVLTVPGSALFRRGTEWQVFVVSGGRAHRRTVAVGHRGSQDTEILSGLAPGEQVIRFPTDRIDEGVRVKGGAPSALN
jgi:HlyD family secretion protein